MKYLLLDCVLFEGTSGLDFLYNCIRPRIKRCTQGESVSLYSNVGIVLSGKVEFDGRVYAKDSFFGETYTMLSRPAPEFIAPKPCSVMLIPTDALKRPCEKYCPDHARMIENFNKLVLERLDYERVRNRLLEVHGIKNRYLAYLSYLHARQGTNPVTSPLRVGQIAEYLCVSRPSLSREIKTLCSEGIISINDGYIKIANNTSSIDIANNVNSINIVKK